MQLRFNELYIKNFLSYGDASIKLNDRGYCLVSGINNCAADNANNNGSGKSALASAICFVLTGETIQGLSTNLKNINIEEDICYVKLDFNVDADHYIITRTKNPKSELSIIKNDTDISGKGIRESEAILKAELPDLNSRFLASIAILGQGLPYKFSDNSPSGRKEVLEQLSKSDFMIQDLKNRLNDRLEFLNTKLREYEDIILSKTSNQKLLQEQYEQQSKELEALKSVNIDDMVKIISELELEVDTLNKSIQESSNIITDLQKSNSEENEKLTKINNEKAEGLQQENIRYMEIYNQYLSKKSELSANISTLEAKIKQLSSITDICPTCGQKLPDVVKPDFSVEQSELEKLNADLTAIETKYTFILNEHNRFLNDIENSAKQQSQDILYQIKNIKQMIEVQQANVTNKSAILLQKQAELSQNKLNKDNFEEKVKNLNSVLYNLDLSIKKLDEEILYNIKEKEIISNHLSVVSQMNTLTKRDFRGFLLLDIINFMNKKVKEYCKEVFNTDLLSFELNGNNIDIKYNNKNFENLSGGEKQKVDLILQLSIRDMMKETLGLTSNILVLDEILDNLDIIGCTNILNLIMNKCNDIETIFIISHRAGELEIPYDSKITIVKNEKGISNILCH